jgi:hypothetical protein
MLAKHKKMMEKANVIISDVITELQDSYDTKSETWQDGEAGCEMSELIECIEEIHGTIQDIITN